MQKVTNRDEASICTKISPSDLDELKIPNIMQIYLKATFNSVMHFTTDTNKVTDYQNEVAPMEGFEKQL